METRAGDPGAFARFDLASVPSPAFVVDEAAVRRNLAILADVRDRAGIKLLAALKAFSMWSLGSVVAEYLDGVCASGLYEARLGRVRSRPIAPDTRRRICRKSARFLTISSSILRASTRDFGLYWRPRA